MQSGYFIPHRFYRSWLPENMDKIIIIFHGLGEHSGRYAHVAEYFNQHGYGVFVLDHIGHGKTEGKRGHVDSFADYIDNARLFIDFIEQETQIHEYVLIGHSLGGVIAHLYALSDDARIKRLVLSSPGYQKLEKVGALKHLLGILFSSLFPKLLLSNELTAEQVSRDPAVVKDYAEDPLNHDRVSTRFYSSFLAAIEQIDSNPTVSMPVLFIVAGDDKIVSPEKTRKVFESMKSKQKYYIEYPQFYHEIFNEKEQQTVFNDVLNWLQNSSQNQFK